MKLRVRLRGGDWKCFPGGCVAPSRWARRDLRKRAKSGSSSAPGVRPSPSGMVWDAADSLARSTSPGEEAYPEPAHPQGRERMVGTCRWPRKPFPWVVEVRGVGG